MARLIDADALHKRLYKEFDHNSRLVGKQAVASAWQGAMQLLYDAPTIDPVKHGKWKYDEDVKALYCGCCGIFAQPQRKTNYCPHCGADMRGE